MDKWSKRILAIYQIGGSLYGISLCFMMLFRSHFILVKVFLLFIFLFSLGISAGYFLMKNPKKGVLLSLFYQGIQILWVSSSFVSFHMSSGLIIRLHYLIGTDTFQSSMSIGSHFYFSFFTEAPFTIGINFIAFILFLYMLKVKRNINNS